MRGEPDYDVYTENDPDDVPTCIHCGYDMEREECWQCHGEGGRYPAEDLPLEYDLDEWEPCDECSGEGYYWQCPNVPHRTPPAPPQPQQEGQDNDRTE